MVCPVRMMMVLVGPVATLDIRRNLGSSLIVSEGFSGDSRVIALNDTGEDQFDTDQGQLPEDENKTSLELLEGVFPENMKSIEESAHDMRVTYNRNDNISFTTRLLRILYDTGSILVSLVKMISGVWIWWMCCMVYCLIALIQCSCACIL